MRVGGTASNVHIEPLMLPASRPGCRPSVDLREVLNAIRYLAHSGGGWRMLPSRP